MPDDPQFHMLTVAIPNQVVPGFRPGWNVIAYEPIQSSVTLSRYRECAAYVKSIGGSTAILVTGADRKGNPQVVTRDVSTYAPPFDLATVNYPDQGTIRGLLDKARAYGAANGGRKSRKQAGIGLVPIAAMVVVGLGAAGGVGYVTLYAPKARAVAEAERHTDVYRSMGANKYLRMRVNPDGTTAYSEVRGQSVPWIGDGTGRDSGERLRGMSSHFSNQ